jgi:hypothetical protein
MICKSNLLSASEQVLDPAICQGFHSVCSSRRLAEHYKDALMYSEMILSKAPENELVKQFQPLLAHLAVQVQITRLLSLCGI